MTAEERAISVSRTIPAPAEAIFDVISNPAMHPVIDGSGTVKRHRGPDDRRLELGSRFGMGMRIGLPYRISNEVVECEPPRLLAWRHFGHHRWRFSLEEVDDGTVVTHTFDWSTARSPRFIEMMGYPKKHPEAMARTLERLEEVVAGSA